MQLKGGHFIVALFWVATVAGICLFFVPWRSERVFSGFAPLWSPPHAVSRVDFAILTVIFVALTAISIATILVISIPGLSPRKFPKRFWQVVCALVVIAATIFVTISYVMPTLESSRNESRIHAIEAERLDSAIKKIPNSWTWVREILEQTNWKSLNLNTEAEEYAVAAVKELDSLRQIFLDAKFRKMAGLTPWENPNLRYTEQGGAFISARLSLVSMTAGFLRVAAPKIPTELSAAIKTRLESVTDSIVTAYYLEMDRLKEIVKGATRNHSRNQRNRITVEFCEEGLEIPFWLALAKGDSTEAEQFHKLSNSLSEGSP